MATLDLEASTVYEDLIGQINRIMLLEGGSRSTKTWSLCQLIITKCLSERDKIWTITRKTLPALKATAMKDFFSVLKAYGLYNEGNHNKTDNIYFLNGNEIAFISLDQPQKIRGRRQNYVWMNEANDLTYEDFTQFNLRLSNPSNDGAMNQIFLDYNPSDAYSWIYDRLEPREDCTLLKSTYLDNPFLDDETIRVIESLKGSDDNYWRIYGLGERGLSLATIFSNWEWVDEFPKFSELKDWCYGLDFGYNDPTVLIRVGFGDGVLYWDELLYESYLTTPDIIKRFETLGISKGKYIFADGSRPETIKQIGQSGYNIRGADKDVLEGIRLIKTLKLKVTSRSTNTGNELKNYKWKTHATLLGQDGQPLILDEPLGLNDHSIDAGRYGTFSHLRGKMTGRPVFTIPK
jgi:phage terminase large subunit